MKIHIRRKPGNILHQGLFEIGGETYPCSLGKSGITTQKQEGDGATPAGTFRLMYGYVRSDRMPRVPSLLPMVDISAGIGWCDAPTHPAYNSPIDLPFKASHEVLARDDHLYDVCIVLDYNVTTKKRNAGSAIFFHLTRPDRGPTEGCVAIDPDLMRLLLPKLSDRSEMIIHP
jgi:L,D-peptidoglycan transpeptidase YkuD (ErfK/YbiS/YcfS/YnhG family)